MQVNLNTDINQSSPQFGKLKAIRFERPFQQYALRNSFPARKKMLEICELPIVKDIFRKYDGEISFTVLSKRDYNYSPSKDFHTAKCYIELETNKSELEKIQKSYIYKGLEKAGDYDSFDMGSLFDKTYHCLGEVKVCSDTCMDAIEKLINKIKNYRTPTFNRIKKEYIDQSSRDLEMYKEDCEKHLDAMRSNMSPAEERKEFAKKIKKLLGDNL